jgi:hypothetical protein
MEKDSDKTGIQKVMSKQMTFLPSSTRDIVNDGYRMFLVLASTRNIGSGGKRVLNLSVC